MANYKRNGKLEEMIRKPAVADAFYPADPQQLSTLLESYLAKAKKMDSPGRLKILIVPHAGLVYSGRTAAWGFKQIEKADYSRVILLGTSHSSWFDYAAVYDKGVWETPLGKVAIDEKTADKIIDKVNLVADKKPHTSEHSLEMELIFLQKIISGFKIIPILVSQISEELSENLAQKISENLGEKTLLIVSTDLSHYPPGPVANEVDQKTIEAIVSGKASQFLEEMKRLERKGYPGLETAACGQSAITVAMKIAGKFKIKFKKIYYENSGEVTGDKSRVVGYAAIGGWSNDK